MEAHVEHAAPHRQTLHGHQHEGPGDSRALNGLAVSATLHCLTGCAIGEVAGMAIGTALGFSDLGTIALAVGLAFLFGYGLTSLPLLRAGLALGAVIPIALAADTFSIATMEIVDNLIMVVIPGAMESGLASWLFWGALSFALAVAFVIALPVNRWLIARGKGHAVVHETGIHGGPPAWVVGLATAIAFVFGTTVLVVEAIGSGGGHGNAGPAAINHNEKESSMKTNVDHAEHGSMAGDSVAGLAISADGLTLELEKTKLRQGERSTLGFSILGDDGGVIRDFEVEHDRRMHLIVVRRDLEGFQHLHPRMDPSGRWRTDIELPEAGSYRVFADFSRQGEGATLASDINVDGDVRWEGLPPPSNGVSGGDRYQVSLAGTDARRDEASELVFTVTRDGEAVELDPYLGAGGHLVALREGDLAFLHTHPEGEHRQADPGELRFMTQYPSAGRYRLYLQFRHGGAVRTAAFTREVAR